MLSAATNRIKVTAKGTGKRGFYKSLLVFVKSEGKWETVFLVLLRLAFLR